MFLFTVRWRSIVVLLSLVFSLFVWNEFLVYYAVLLSCRWPQLPSDDPGFGSSSGTLKAMLIADTHLLGSREGHWFDKLRREWMMERSFQASMMLHSPDIVFVLGDLFDEGKWCSDLEFQHYVERFHRMFRRPEHTQLEVVVGNHDIGFHYMVDDSKRRRFASSFSAPSVRLLRKKHNVFVMLNSMAFEGDHCKMCTEAEDQLNDIIKTLNCAQGNIEREYCRSEDLFPYSKPVILQHFPMYRPSDSNCTGPDSAPPKEKYSRFQQKYDCLSQDVSNKLLAWLKPQLIISAHTHHFCYTEHGTVPEWTIPSYSWRNKRNPSFILLSLSGDEHSVHKCYLPDEQTVVYTYIGGATFIVILILYTIIQRGTYSSYYGFKSH